jgi:hypothetical protein
MNNAIARSSGPVSEKLARLGWARGRVLSPDHATKLACLMRIAETDYTHATENWILVASQTCDLLPFVDDSEPFVELIVGRPISVLDSNRANLQSTRWLDVRVAPGGQALRLSATQRYFVLRTALEDAAPDQNRVLDETATAKMGAWLGLRYTRPAWPDEFVSRLRPKERPLAKLLGKKQSAADIEEIWVTLDPREEILSSDPYRLSIVFVISDDKLQDDPLLVRRANNTHAEMIALLQKCRGIEIDGDISRVAPGSKFSWEEMSARDRWNWDYLSGIAD